MKFLPTMMLAWAALLSTATPAVAACKAPAAAATASAPAASAAAHAAPVDINTASRAALCALDGLNDDSADAVISGRPYASLDELVGKRILTSAVFQRIKPHIVASKPPAPASAAASAPKPASAPSRPPAR